MARTDKVPRTRLDPDTRRAALLEAAQAAFADASYSEVTISAIASAAGASDALVYRYFGGKDELYAAVVASALESMLEDQAAAVQALGAGAARRERVKVATLVYVDHVAASRLMWAGPPGAMTGEPSAASAVRAQERAVMAERLRAMLAPSQQVRHEYAVWGFLGFLDGACGRWVAQGCPDDQRWPLVEAALGALEGALGDWAA